jgi:hypothetical protein
MTWRLMAWSELLKSRNAYKKEILRSHKSHELLPCGNGTNRSDAIDWSKLQRSPEFIGFD